MFLLESYGTRCYYVKMASTVERVPARNVAYTGNLADTVRASWSKGQCGNHKIIDLSTRAAIANMKEFVEIAHLAA